MKHPRSCFRSLWTVGTLLIGLAVYVAPMAAQSVAGSIVGSVTDASSAIISRIRVGFSGAIRRSAQR